MSVRVTFVGTGAISCHDEGRSTSSPQEIAMLSIPQAVTRIQSRFPDTLPEALIRRPAQEVGHRGRDRDLRPVVPTYLFLQQVLHGDVAVAELRRLSGTDFTAPAYCQARARLPRPPGGALAAGRHPILGQRHRGEPGRTGARPPRLPPRRLQLL